MVTRLEEVRLEKGFSINEVTNRVGISNMSYYRYAQGKRKPPIDVAQKLASTLNTTVEKLFPVDNDKK